MSVSVRVFLGCVRISVLMIQKPRNIDYRTGSPICVILGVQFRKKSADRQNEVVKVVSSKGVENLGLATRVWAQKIGNSLLNNSYISQVFDTCLHWSKNCQKSFWPPCLTPLWPAHSADQLISSWKLWSRNWTPKMTQMVFSWQKPPAFSWCLKSDNNSRKYVVLSPFYFA